MGNPFFLPSGAGLQDELPHRAHDAAPATGGAPHRRLHVEMTGKRAAPPAAHTAVQPVHKQRGHDQADEPAGTAGLGFPKPRLRVAVSAIPGLEVAMHAAFGKPGAIRQAPDALLTVFTNRVENDNALGPQSHGVGPSFEERRNSGSNSLSQSTGPMPDCPALNGSPTGPSGADVCLGGQIQAVVAAV